MDKDTSDLVGRLREGCWISAELGDEAADKIESLTAECEDRTHRLKDALHCHTIKEAKLVGEITRLREELAGEWISDRLPDSDGRFNIIYSENGRIRRPFIGDYLVVEDRWTGLPDGSVIAWREIPEYPPPNNGE